MKKAVLSLGALLLVAGSAVWAKQHEGAAKTIEGEVLDMTCYMGHETSGAKHGKCAKACLVGGAPAGLLTGKGEVYLLVADHKNPKAYDAVKQLGGEKAKVSGTMVKRGGIQALVVQGAEKSR